MSPSQPWQLGFIRKRDRSQQQWDVHNAAEAQMLKAHGLPDLTVQAGTKVMLTDFWKTKVVTDALGFAFPRFHQLTGSCVGAGGGNGVMTLVCVQANIASSPSKPVLPFWPFDYGRCRYNEGDRGQGEGAMGSSFADTIVKEGVLDALEPGLPQFQNNDGLVLSSHLEMQWSDGGSSLVTNYLSAAKKFPLGTSVPVKSAQDIKNLILQGYPGSFACDNYIGDASVQGSGADSAVCGYWNGRGGHQQYFVGYWENATLGPLYGIGNNWPGDTYPADPGGLPLCCCWVTEKHVDSAIQNLDSEVYGFSHLTWFPGQPALLDWFM